MATFESASNEKDKDLQQKGSLLRLGSQDTNGARIQDTRNHGCVVEMLGKKKQLGACVASQVELHQALPLISGL